MLGRLLTNPRAAPVRASAWASGCDPIFSAAGRSNDGKQLGSKQIGTFLGTGCYEKNYRKTTPQ
jgi:hypothetical protein